MPSAVRLEIDLPQPTVEFRFRIYSDTVPDTLQKLDATLSRNAIPFHIKSLGSSKVFMGIVRTTRFQLIVSQEASETAKGVLHELGAA